MAGAAPLVKLLRQLSSAQDDYRSGALDIAWDGGEASLFLVFGRPNHAIFKGSDGRELEGTEALSALVTQLPRKFRLAPWRSVVVRTESLRCTLDELMEPLSQLAGAAAPDQATESSAPTSDLDIGSGLVDELDFGLEQFPLLPLGRWLWSDAATHVVHLDVLIPKLPDALIVLTGPTLRAAAVVVGKQIIDAVWINESEQALGQAAARALMGTRDGTVSGYRLDNPRLAEALTMLWRCPTQFKDLRTSWIDPDGLLREIEEEQRDCAIVISGPVKGVGLFVSGELVGVYTDTERQPSVDAHRLRELLRQDGGTLTLRQRAGDRSRTPNVPEESYHAFVDDAPEEGSDAPIDPDPSGAVGTPDDVRAWHPVEVAPAQSGSDLGRDDPEGERAPAAGIGSDPELAPEDIAIEPGTLATVEGTGQSRAEPSPSLDEDAIPVMSRDGTEADATDDRSGMDYESVRADLIQIGVLWLGEADVAPVADLIRKTGASVDEFVSTIDHIKGMTIAGHEASVVRAMAREMHYLAAEHLCGA